MVEPVERPRLLLVTRNFPPLWGGMERLNWHLADELRQWFDVRIVGPTGSGEHAPPGVAIREARLRPLSRFLIEAGIRALHEARAWRPHVVLAGSGLTAPLALVAARLCGAKAVAYVHGLDLTVPHPVYRALWRPALRRMDGLISNSHACGALAQGIGVTPTRISVVHPGVTLPVPDPMARGRFRTAFGLGEAPILLSVGRLTSRKGLREFVSEALPLIVAEHPEVRLVVIGDAPTDSLHAQSQSPASILAAAEAAGVGSTVMLLGKKFGRDLADAYAAADVHVFPVIDIPDDPEGFGMVAVEAAAHGLATVAYATGGVPDAVRDGVSGRLVPPGDVAGFAKAVLALLGNRGDNTAMRAFAQEFAWPTFGKHVRKALAIPPTHNQRP